MTDTRTRPAEAVPLDPKNLTAEQTALLALCHRLEKIASAFDRPDLSSLARQQLSLVAQGKTSPWFSTFQANADRRAELQGPPLDRHLLAAFADAARVALKTDLRSTIFDTDDGAEDWTADAPDLAAYWGTSSKAYGLAGARPLLIFGNGGAGKTLTALNLAAGLLGLDGYGYLLGEPVTPLPAGESVLMLTLDGPAEARAS